MISRIRWLLVAALVVSVASVASAQETALGTSSWSLELGAQFEEDNSFMIGLRRHLSETSALRIGLGGLYDAADGDGSQTSPPSPPAPTRRESEFYFYEAALQWIHYSGLMDRVAAQFGIGPVARVSRSFSRNANNVGLPTFTESEFSNRDLEYGLGLSLGVEWFFTRRFSLGGRASMRGVMGSRKDSSIFRSPGGNSQQTNDADRIRFETDASTILLTGYF